MRLEAAKLQLAVAGGKHLDQSNDRRSLVVSWRYSKIDRLRSPDSS